MLPHPDNACSGKYSDWLEVNLLPECNANCSWCIESSGFHPKTKVSPEEMVDAIVKSGKHNIILLGGEPTLYDELSFLIEQLVLRTLNVYITTNGSILSSDFVKNNFQELKGMNISIHHFVMSENEKITRLLLDPKQLTDAIREVHRYGTTVRLNCNCMKGYIDSYDGMKDYVAFAKEIGADSVRFAELKNSSDFVSIPEIFSMNIAHAPFTEGCSINTVLDGMPVNLRLMCGLQTPFRPAPCNPEQTLHPVLYYDGKLYEGWQTEMTKSDNEIMEILTQMENGDLSASEGKAQIEKILKKASAEKTVKTTQNTGVGCRY